jgi:molybdopterin molybdotransferase
MITTAEATQAIAAAMPAFATEKVPLAEARGRILSEPVVAERDQPPFDRVTMDGIAVQFEYFASGNRQFTIQGTQHAGDPVQTLTSSVHAIEIMTGAVLPRNSDCVIPVERINVQDGVATVEDDYEAEHLQFVHPQGSDYAEGHHVLNAGLSITPMDIAIIASCGLGKQSTERTRHFDRQRTRAAGQTSRGTPGQAIERPCAGCDAAATGFSTNVG